MSLTTLKLLLALGTLVAGALGGILPLAGGRRAGNGAMVGAGNAFAAGLFLAIGMIHFLPESAASFARAGSGYPLASLLAVGSFLVLLLLEHVLVPDAAHDAAHAHSGTEHHDHGTRAGHHHELQGPGGAAKQVVRTSPYVLVTALAVHSFLAGGALGAESDARGAMLTFLAIAVHKGAAGLALGLALIAAGMGRRPALRLIWLFALMTPLGIVLGTVVGQAVRGDGQAFLDAAAAALAAGTFLYIGTFDLVQDEFLGAGRRWTKWVCAVIGASLAALLAIWL